VNRGTPVERNGFEQAGSLLVEQAWNPQVLIHGHENEPVSSAEPIEARSYRDRAKGALQWMARPRADAAPAIRPNRRRANRIEPAASSLPSPAVDAPGLEGGDHLGEPRTRGDQHSEHRVRAPREGPARARRRRGEATVCRLHGRVVTATSPTTTAFSTWPARVTLPRTSVSRRNFSRKCGTLPSLCCDAKRIGRTEHEHHRQGIGGKSHLFTKV